MVILSFTIKDMRDEVEHLESLGKAQTAVVRLWGQHQPKQKEPEKHLNKHKRSGLNTKIYHDTKLQCKYLCIKRLRSGETPHNNENYSL